MIIKVIAAITPKILLPPGTKVIADQNGGKKVSLNIQESRELLERNLTYHLDQFLNKYSPLRRSIKFYKEQRLKQKQDQFYCLMGQIALTHAAIEQDLKNTLMVDWGVLEKFNYDKKIRNMEHLHGRDLRMIFIELLRDLLIPKEFLKEYEVLRDEFWTLSNKRNEFLKATYSFNEKTAEVSQIHEKNHDKYDGSVSYEEMINSWMPKVNFSDLESLLKGLIALRGKFMNVRAKVFRDKIRLHSELCSEIGKMYPAYAFKNPYWYQASSKKGDDAGTIEN